MKQDLYFFDANGPVGFSRRNDADFPDCRALLRHMDRLGIARSLVWNVQAKDHHPGTGNGLIMAEVAKADPRHRRLVPSLAVAATMLYERHSLDELGEAFRTGQVRALRAFPGTLHYNLRHLEPVIERVEAFRPVVFIDTRELGGDTDILAFAQRFPELKIVCLHGMWPTLFNFSLLDLMRRCPNVLIDNSVLHTNGTLKMIVEKFGPDRVVFGTHCKANNGASIAHLLGAGIDDKTRAMIAHGTLEHLLGLDPLAAAPTTRGRKAGLWSDYLDGKPVAGGIVDAHGHLGSVGTWAIPERGVEEQVPAMVRRMKEFGIRTTIVSGLDALFADPVEGNRLLEKHASRSGGRIRGYLSFNPFYAKALVPQFGDFFSRPFFVGFKTLCDYWQVPVTDERFKPCYQYANDHRMPILLHTWEGWCDSPGLLKGVVKEYPDAFFLLGHSGGGDGGRREAVQLAKENPNVYLEFCGSFCSRIPWEETLQEVGPDRVVFGTDTTGHDVAWELGRFLSIDLPPDRLRPALGANMRRILGKRV